MKGSRRGLALACFMATMSSIENLSVEQLHKINTWKKFVDERPWSARKMKSNAFPVDPVGCDLSLWRWKLENPDGRPRNDRRTYVMQVSYLGTDFSAVQRCPGVRTVQEEVEKVLESIFTNYSTRPHSLGGQILACMRTHRFAGEDREGSKVMGQQMFSFHCWDAIKTCQLVEDMNSRLPRDVRVMPRSFHANFAATWRKYCYVFPLQEIGAGRFDVEAEEVDSMLRGLEGRRRHYNSFSYKVLVVELTANRFLRRMVRKLVATAIRAAAFPEEENSFTKILEACDSSRSAPPLPSIGLCLVGVGYDDYDKKRGGAAIHSLA
ncbi:hypothetical protein GUITHDRAFT_115478 [Guillardia theta CCMP2712]|uniref:tRNA pseudouridine synthase n=1 Tax=Guillardia theta (strain CCMP2712) TaxID=905079 RepID=L1IR33_GUITC|nr:hypothetical protein GUITHDRAFT_115478 [Guillardia theta CCMP2712]EKX38329.1 hypothetical protein GUITHDRAFT_115478 [Guillardia theta CCMP2712]|eukprot:XP_005825309.1 hypothetical protein GUITHDRAFT_115478 [Guillardia theta CCMP2712]